jgi:hypothetical protein
MRTRLLVTEREAPQQEQDRCPSVSSKGKRCSGRVGHGGMHQAEEAGVLYAWTDDSSPACAIDLIR